MHSLLFHDNAINWYIYMVQYGISTIHKDIDDIFTTLKSSLAYY